MRRAGNFVSRSIPPACVAQCTRLQARSTSDSIPPKMLEEIDRRISDNYQRTLDKYNEKQRTRNLTDFYASMIPAKVNLNEIVVWLDNPNYDPYVFCHRQLPILLANLVQQLRDLPIGLSSMPSIHATKAVLVESFSQLVKVPVPDSLSIEKRYIEVLKAVDERHAEFDMIVKMATGILELKSYMQRHQDAIQRLRKVSGRSSITGQIEMIRAKELADDANRFTTASGNHIHEDFEEELLRIQEPIDRFNKNLVEFNFISRQLVNFADRMTEEGETPKAVDADANCMTMKRPSKMSHAVDLQEVIKNAVYDARQICESHYGDAPDVVYDILTQPLVGHQRHSPMPAAVPSASKGSASKSLLSSGSKQPHMNTSAKSTSRAAVDGGDIYAHICPTVHYIVVELMKNALRATIEAHMKTNAMGVICCDAMPPVRVTINARRGLQHSCVCVEDRGIGIKRSDMGKVMSYSYTTAKSILDKDDDEDDAPTSNNSVAPLAGYGYGLPMSRAYARSFGGDILVQSVEGYGTRVSLYLLAAQQ